MSSELADGAVADVVVTADACMICERPLKPVHGHWACYTPGCQMWGMNQVPCCEGAPCPVPSRT